MWIKKIMLHDMIPFILAFVIVIASVPFISASGNMEPQIIMRFQGSNDGSSWTSGTYNITATENNISQANFKFWRLKDIIVYNPNSTQNTINFHFEVGGFHAHNTDVPSAYINLNPIISSSSPSVTLTNNPSTTSASTSLRNFQWVYSNWQQGFVPNVFANNYCTYSNRIFTGDITVNFDDLQRYVIINFNSDTMPTWSYTVNGLTIDRCYLMVHTQAWITYSFSPIIGSLTLIWSEMRLFREDFNYWAQQWEQVISQGATTNQKLQDISNSLNNIESIMETHEALTGEFLEAGGQEAIDSAADRVGDNDAFGVVDDIGDVLSNYADFNSNNLSEAGSIGFGWFSQSNADWLRNIPTTRSSSQDLQYPDFLSENLEKILDAVGRDD